MPAIISRRLRAAVGLLAMTLGTQVLGSPAPGAHMPAPALAGRIFQGEPFDLNAWRGKVVVLNFWASWCEPCRAEMPLLDTLQRDYRERGVIVLGLSADDRHDRKEAFKAAQGVGYITGMLSDASINGFGAPQVLPLTYIIDGTGTVTAVLRANRGTLSAEQLRAAVERALGAALPAAKS